MVCVDQVYVMDRLLTGWAVLVGERNVNHPWTSVFKVCNESSLQNVFNLCH